MNRRAVLKALLSSTAAIASTILFPIKVLAKWNEAAFSAEKINTALSEFYPGKEIIPNNKITITVRPEIENGAVVPIKVDTDLPDVESIAIFVENNPNPLIANFDLSPKCKGFVSARIKMDGPSDILIIVVSKMQTFLDNQNLK
ncbi:MAG: thiosulfate oxidation carrier protein SoxY [Pseudomonadota bacterium]